MAAAAGVATLRRVRIAHVTDCYPPRSGGIESQVADLAAQQAAAGDDVHVLTATPAAQPRHAAPSGPRPGSQGGATVHRIVGGPPQVEIVGTVAARADALGITRWHLSISHDAGIASAMVVAEG